MDKLKSIKNAVTGGGAKVSIEIGEASLGETLSIKVKAVIDNADVKVEERRFMPLVQEGLSFTIIEVW